MARSLIHGAHKIKKHQIKIIFKISIPNPAESENR